MTHESERRAKVGLAVAAMLEAHGQEATQARLYGYWLALGDLGAEEVQQAIAEALKKHSRVASPAEIRELVEGGPVEQRAEAAWLEVGKATTHGPYRHVDFEDQVINAAIRSLGGWPELFERCTSAKETKWYRLEFIRAYKAFATSGVDGDACRPLAGISECEIVNGERSKPVPRRIACAVKQKRIAGERAVLALEFQKP